MSVNPVVFSFFRYPSRHAFSAFVLMGFQGLFRGKRFEADKVRLMGCGGRDGFSIVPNFNRYCLFSAQTQGDDLDRLRSSAFYRYVSRPSVEQLHFELVPISGHGVWDGKAIFEYAGQPVGKQPFAVLTRARVKPSRMGDFWRGVPSIRRHLDDTPGCVYRMGFGERPLLTLATFSVWENFESMQGFAYRHSPHHLVSQAARTEHWLTESLFVRFEIKNIEGDLASYPKLLNLNRV